MAKVNKPGFRIQKIKNSLLGKNSGDWRSYVRLSTPLLWDSGDIISLGDRYIISLGAHGTHVQLLMDQGALQPLTVELSLNSCALLSFLTDSPIVPFHSAKNDCEAINIKQFNLSLKGSPLKDAEEYFQMLEDAAMNCSLFVERLSGSKISIHRQLIYNDCNRGEWIYADWPASHETWRAITAYWSALLSPAVPARLLNFWRGMEAVKKTKPARSDLFRRLNGTRSLPLWSRVLDHKSNKFRRINAATQLRARALKHRAWLIARFGTDAKALDSLYWDKRGKAAHADRYTLEYDGIATLGEQLRDTELLQYMARVAIEEEWK